MIIVLLLFLYFLLIIYWHKKYPEIRWDWSKVDYSSVKFPETFFWGTATASHQVEGYCDNNNWYKWENNFDENNNPRIKDNQVAGIACDHWNKYKEDIKLIKDLGVTHYRLSLEWSKIEPENGVYNQDALDHYKNVILALKDNDITPFITLHHFTNPIWFDKLGGFEKEDNIGYFIEFS